MTRPTTSDDCEAAPRGRREGQFAYYVEAAKRERGGPRCKWRRFWVARWFWSAGRIGPVPMGYRKDYWR